MEPSPNSADIGPETLRRFDRGAVSQKTVDRVVQAIADSSEVQRRLEEIAWLPTEWSRVGKDAAEGSEAPTPSGGIGGQADATVKSIATVARSVSDRSDFGSLQDDALAAALQQDSNYECVSKLGVGGMGVVFEVIYHGMGAPRREAVKILHPSLTRQSNLRRRFDRELQSLVQMSDHPCVTTAYRRVDLPTSLGYAMELVPGENLHDLVQWRGGMPVPLACQIAADVASTLALAHQRGLVHRDIKPCNLMVHPERNQWRTKVLDFGLAKLVRGPATEALTHAGAVLGTPQFMAPEQIRDPSAADIRSDLYSLGCTLFFLLTAKPVFEGTYDQILLGHVRPARPSIAEHRPDVPSPLASIVKRLIHHDPDQRYDDPAKLESELAEFIDAKGWLAVDAVDTPTHGPLSGTATARPPAMIDTAGESFREVETADRHHDSTTARPSIKRISNVSPKRGLRLRRRVVATMLFASAVVASLLGTRARSFSRTATSGRDPTQPHSIAKIASVSPDADASRNQPNPRPNAESSDADRMTRPLDDHRDAYVVWGSPWHIDEGHLVQAAGWGEQWLVFGDTQWTDYIFEFEYLSRPGPCCLSTLVACDDEGKMLSCGVGWLGGRKVLELSEPKDRFQPIRESEPFQLNATDQWRTVTTRLEAGQLSFWVDGENVWLNEPVPRTHGRVGIRTYSRSKDRELRIRNIRVKSLDGKSLWDGLPKLPMDLFAGSAHSVDQLRSSRLEIDGQRWRSLLSVDAAQSGATGSSGSNRLPSGWTFGGSPGTWAFRDGLLTSAGYSSWDKFREDIPVQLKTESAFEDFLLHARVSLDADADNGIVFRRSGEACVEVTLEPGNLGEIILWGDRRWTFRKGFRMSRRLEDLDVRQPFDIYLRCDNANITVWVNDQWVAYAHLPDSRVKSPIELWPCPRSGSRTIFHALEWLPIIDPATFTRLPAT